jgi:hypothetical protein
MVKSLLLRLMIAGPVLLPWMAGASGASQLLSTHSSYHQKDKFAILVLRFDAKTEYRFAEQANGLTGTITLMNCSIETQATADLIAVKNPLIKKIDTQKAGRDLNIALQFGQAAKLKLRQTENPFSLIVDIAPTPKNAKESPKVSPAPSKEKAAPKKTPTKETKSKPSKNRNRLAEVTPAPPMPINEEADKARQMAVYYDQTGDTAGEVKQWETFLHALFGADSAAQVTPPIDLAKGSPEKSVLTEPSRAEAPVGGAARPSPWRLPLEFALCLAILTLGIISLMLYLRQRELNRAIQALLSGMPEEEKKPFRGGRPAAADRNPEVAPETIQKTSSVSAASERPSEDTAREVLGLYRTGMAIPAIAEKMRMGQDEIRLILNLAREEKTTV